MVAKNRVIEFLELLKFNQDSRNTVSDKLHELRDVNLIPILFEIINDDESQEVKIAAIRSLGFLEDPLTVKFLTEFIKKEENQKLVKEAIYAVSFFKSNIVVDCLTEIINDTKDDEIKTVASQAIQIIQGIVPPYAFDSEL